MAQRPISKITVPGDLEGRTTLTWEVYRDFSSEGDWHDRYVQNPETKETLYFCYVEPREDLKDKEYIFRRGGKDGPIIARATPCANKKYALDLHLEDPKVTIPISHKHHFKSEGKWFCWKTRGPTEEGEYHPNIFTGSDYEFAIQEPKATLQQVQDLLVITAILIEEREEEKMGPVAPCLKSLIPAHLGKEARLGVVSGGS